MKLRPMLATAAPADLDTLAFPLFASPKLDGFRCLMVDPLWYRQHIGDSLQAQHALAVTRSLKPLPNAFTRKLLDRPELVGLDGELLTGNPTDADIFNRTTSALRRHDGEPDDIQFHAFDIWNHPGRFEERLYALAERCNLPSFVRPLEQTLTPTVDDLEAVEADYLVAGFEGHDCPTARTSSDAARPPSSTC